MSPAVNLKLVDPTSDPSEAARPQPGVLEPIGGGGLVQAAAVDEAAPAASAAPARDPLAALLAERDRLAERLARLDVFADRANEARIRIHEVDTAIGAIDRADADAAVRYATSGGDAEPPEPLIAERKALLARRLDAEAELAAAEAGQAAVLPQRERIVAEMRRTELALLELRLAGAVTDAHALQAEAERIAAKLAVPLNQILSLQAALSMLAVAAENRNDHPAQLRIAGALSTISAMTPPIIMRDADAIAAGAAAWGAKLR